MGSYEPRKYKSGTAAFPTPPVVARPQFFQQFSQINDSENNKKRLIQAVHPNIGDLNRIKGVLILAKKRPKRLAPFWSLNL